LLDGPNSIQIAFSETMSSAGGFGFDYAIASFNAVPGPIVGAGLPGLLAGFGVILAWYRKRRAVAASFRAPMLPASIITDHTNNGIT